MKLIDIKDEINDSVESDYAVFSQKLANSGLKIIGVRLPKLHALSKKYKTADTNGFVIDGIYEYAFVYFAVRFQNLKNLDEIFDILAENEQYWLGWNLVDTVCKYIKLPKDFKDAKKVITTLAKSENEYIARLSYLLCFYYAKDDAALEDILALIKEDDRYYVMMAEAWLLSTLYIHHQNEIFMFIKEAKLGKILTNKSISKITDSFRVSAEEKAKIRALRK